MDWIVKNEKSTGILRHFSHALDPFEFEVWHPRFLLTKPPLEGTQDAQLPTPSATKLLYSQEHPPIPSNNEEREPILEPIYQEVTEKYFKVFYREDAPSTSTTHSLLEMDFEEKTSDLLALLTAHVRGFSPVIAVMPRPPTPATARTSLAEATNKKRKHG